MNGLAQWLHARQANWRDIEKQLTKADERHDDVAPVADFVHRFRALVRDLALARTLMPASQITRRLEDLLWRAHRVVYRRPQAPFQQLRDHFRHDVPRVMHRLATPMTVVVSLFVLTGLAGFWLVWRYPELAALFASERMIDGVQQGRLWTDDLLNIMPSSLLSLSIMANNIAVTLFAFALGALYGLGTLYIIGLNGLMLGGVFALTAQYDLADELFSFVVAHGVVELSVICLAGAAGAHLGEALARPGDRSRGAAFRAGVADAATLLPLCALFLVGAGLIEGYVSPDPTYPLAARVAIGLGYWVLFLLALKGRLFGARTNTASLAQSNPPLRA